MSKKGCFIVISGTADVGKETVVNALIEKYENYTLAISATTRSPRNGEINGREHFFKTKEDFEELIHQDALYEYTLYASHYYGTQKVHVQELLQVGKNVVLEVSVQDAFSIKKKYPKAVLIFITHSSAKNSKTLLCGCKMTNEDICSTKKATVTNHYDYLIVNEQLDDCVSYIHNLIHKVIKG